VRGPSPVLVYTASRLGVFVLVAIVLALFGMRGILLLLVAVVISGLLSFVLLSRQRDAMSQAVVDRSARIRNRMREATEAEDEADDAMRAADDQQAADGEGAAHGEREGSGQGESDRDEHGER
jgi:hypothetical protein